MKKGDIEEKIVEAIEYIKANSPRLHLYICGRLLEKAERGTLKIKKKEAKKALGSIFHISRDAQYSIIKELEEFKLLLSISNKEYLIPITKKDYENMFKKSFFE